ncbi:MAG: YggS family pyridoxal phosphate-dependent enzyme [candidate division Zixibacteria bacterium]|nr:YggS family pyridoxal phosphate-dependent enzyme [candidate division Zixibacteria bacterium]
MFDYIEINIRDIKKRIAAAAAHSGHQPQEIAIVAVSKTFSVEAIKAAVKAGLTEIGESRIQEAEPKINALGKIVRWHMVGHLQTNKVKKAIELFQMIQSVDSIRLAEEINSYASKFQKRIDCLLEMNSSGEISKYGINPGETLSLIRQISYLENINLRGLMTIGPLTADKEIIRQSFRLTNEIYLRGRHAIGESFNILSMGMSADFEIAVEEGSNMLRIGSAIFGQRAASHKFEIIKF